MAPRFQQLQASPDSGIQGKGPRMPKAFPPITFPADPLSRIYKIVLKCPVRACRVVPTTGNLRHRGAHSLASLSRLGHDFARTTCFSHTKKADCAIRTSNDARSGLALNHSIKRSMLSGPKVFIKNCLFLRSRLANQTSCSNPTGDSVGSYWLKSVSPLKSIWRLRHIHPVKGVELPAVGTTLHRNT